MSYEFIQVHTEADKVGVITLNRPKQLNALSPDLMIELGTALLAFDADAAIGCIIIILTCGFSRLQSLAQHAALDHAAAVGRSMRLAVQALKSAFRRSTKVKGLR